MTGTAGCGHSQPSCAATPQFNPRTRCHYVETVMSDVGASSSAGSSSGASASAAGASTSANSASSGSGSTASDASGVGSTSSANAGGASSPTSAESMANANTPSQSLADANTPSQSCRGQYARRNAGERGDADRFDAPGTAPPPKSSPGTAPPAGIGPMSTPAPTTSPVADVAPPASWAERPWPTARRAARTSRARVLPTAGRLREHDPRRTGRRHAHRHDRNAARANGFSESFTQAVARNATPTRRTTTTTLRTRTTSAATPRLPALPISAHRSRRRPTRW